MIILIKVYMYIFFITITHFPKDNFCIFIIIKKKKYKRAKKDINNKPKKNKNKFK